MNRRDLILGAMAAGAVPGSANGRVRIACVGIRSQGHNHLLHYAAMPDVEIAALCDIDESVLNARVAEIEKLGRPRPRAFTDFRKLLEDKSIDAVSIATPNHHHTLQTIWACQAGKDVYVEKPCSHDMFEARQIAAAARKYNRLVQHGTNSRSSIAREAIAKIRDGLIGDVYMARGLCFKWRDTIGRAPVAPVPPGVHYDLWLGPARTVPIQNKAVVAAPVRERCRISGTAPRDGQLHRGSRYFPPREAAEAGSETCSAATAAR